MTDHYGDECGPTVITKSEARGFGFSKGLAREGSGLIQIVQ